MSKIREFIDKNGIDFTEGTRNSTMVTLMGYAQHLGLDKDELESELADEISADGVIQDEIDTRWGYCDDNNYSKFWKTKAAKSQYIF